MVRHPGYAGLMVGIVMASVALGSWWSLIPAVALIAQFVLRTVKEDRFLQAELAGYVQYCQAVRYRLLPGIW
jgi:protein-S-isoprenylcysteine O-methyltransferase Ste14